MVTLLTNKVKSSTDSVTLKKQNGTQSEQKQVMLQGESIGFLPLQNNQKP